ncbi:MAG: hypothetical protein RL628_1488 [Actinomycetota bacterium]|jgi:hypothetical protein
MDEFRDSDISSLLNQVAGSSPDTMAAHSAVLGKVRRVRQRRMATVGAAAVVMVVSGAVAMVQNSQNRDRGSNIAVPLSPDNSEPIDVSTTTDIDVTTTISNQTTTIPADVQVPINSQGPSVTTIPTNTPAASTTIGTPVVTVPNSIPSTNAPSGSPVTTRPPTTTRPPSTLVPITPAPSTQAPTTPPKTTPSPTTSPPTIIPELKTWSCGGGEVDYRVTSSGLVLIDARPAAGFTASEKKAKGDEITVKFIPNAKNDGRKSSLKIKKSRIVSTSCDDEDFDRRSDSEDSGSTNNNDESADD